MSYSCIIPIEAHNVWTEESSRRFYPLKNVFDEVFIVGADHTMQSRLPPNFKRISSSKANRAHLFNLGAEAAKEGYLCFLQYDSDFDTESFAKLRLSLKPQTLFYFNLEYKNPSPSLCKLNAWTANVRSDIAKLPFGNQCFSMDKKSFFEAGAFSERVTNNEDAEFIKRWRKKGFKIKKANGNILTSADNFVKNGWLKTTAKDFVWALKYMIGKEPRELVPHT